MTTRQHLQEVHTRLTEHHVKKAKHHSGLHKHHAALAAHFEKLDGHEDMADSHRGIAEAHKAMADHHIGEGEFHADCAKSLSGTSKAMGMSDVDQLAPDQISGILPDVAVRAVPRFGSPEVRKGDVSEEFSKIYD